MILYSYFRSSAAYRVRLGLAMKGIVPTETRYVNLRANEQRGADYLDINPQGLVPALVLNDGTVLTQSEAILEYLDEAHPGTPALLPTDPVARAFVRGIAQTIACELQPLQNLRVMNYLEQVLEQGSAARQQWLHHWMSLGMQALETRLAQYGSADVCYGETPGLAECFLLPQLFAARRFGLDLAPYPHLRRIETAMLAREDLHGAHPAQQPDFVD